MEGLALDAIRPERVGAYIRWSTDDQATGTTLEVQRDACQSYARSQGWRVGEDLLFIDDGYSGGDLDRPGIARLRQAVRTGSIDCVVVMRIDRLSRNIVDAVDLVLKEWAGRCYLRSVTESFVDTTTELGRLLFGLLAMFADFERTRIRDRTHSGKERRIRQGEQMHGRAAFGYAPDPERKGRWISQPEEAPLVQRLFRLAADGMSANQLARLLNGEGIPTRNGRAWHSQQVLWILHNRTYAGEVEYGRTSVLRVEDGDGRPESGSGGGGSPQPRRRRVTNAQPKIRAGTGAAAMLVDRQLFDRVQGVLASHRVRRAEVGSRAFGSDHLLVGLSRCPCGAPMIHSGTGRRSPAFKGYYLCSRHRQGACAASGYVPARLADALVEREFLALFAVKDLRVPSLRARTGGAESEQRALEGALAQVRQEAARLDAEDRRLLRAARSGKVPFEDMADLRESLRRDRQDVGNRTRGLEDQVTQARMRAHALDATLAALDAADAWFSLPAWRRRQVLRLALDGRIVLGKDRGSGQVTIEAQWLVG